MPQMFSQFLVQIFALYKFFRKNLRKKRRKFSMDPICYLSIVSANKIPWNWISPRLQNMYNVHCTYGVSQKNVLIEQNHNQNWVLCCSKKWSKSQVERAGRMQLQVSQGCQSRNQQQTKNSFFFAQYFPLLQSRTLSSWVRRVSWKRKLLSVSTGETHLYLFQVERTHSFKFLNFSTENDIPIK